jgi:hypothetical protein
VNIDSLQGQARLTHKNLYDRMREEMEYVEFAICAFQHYLKAGLRLNYSAHLFRRLTENDRGEIHADSH